MIVHKIELGDSTLLCSKWNILELRVMPVFAVGHLLAAAAWARYSWGRGWRCRGTSRPSTSPPWTGRSANSTSSTSARRDTHTCSQPPTNPPDRLHPCLSAAVSEPNTHRQACLKTRVHFHWISSPFLCSIYSICCALSASGCCLDATVSLFLYTTQWFASWAQNTELNYCPKQDVAVGSLP